MRKKAKPAARVARPASFTDGPDERLGTGDLSYFGVGLVAGPNLPVLDHEVMIVVAPPLHVDPTPAAIVAVVSAVVIGAAITITIAASVTKAAKANDDIGMMPVMMMGLSGAYHGCSNSGCCSEGDKCFA
jgi:hypothetical protein